jgi:hypothetical protein
MSTTVNAVIVLIAMTATAAADPIALEPFAAKAGSLALPRAWSTHDDGAMISSQADPRRHDSPVIVVVLQPSGVAATEDQLLDGIAGKIAKDVKVTARGALAGGRGHTLVAEGSAGGVTVRLGAVAFVDGGAGAVVVLAARADEFAAIGGLDLARNVIASVKLSPPPQQLPASRPSNALDDVTRGTKRTGQPDLPPGRAAMSMDQLDRAWSRVSGHVVQMVDSRTTTEVRGHYDSHMDTDLFEFFRDGNYTLTSTYRSKNTGCTNEFVTVEHGTYTFDGRTLVMAAKDAATTEALCNAPKTTKPLPQLPGPRTYSVGLAADGYLVMVGPSCSAARDARCYDHARWEMKPGAAK